MRRIARDDDWNDLLQEWQFPEGVTYLNHGSFGPPPQSVIRARGQWQQRMDAQPMDFFVRQFRPAWEIARARLAQFVGAAEEDLVFSENATAAMNVVADSFPLSSSENVLLNDHEYGAVERIWQRRCAQCNAEVRVATLPAKFESAEQIVGSLLASADDRTRMIVVSHITSPTAIIMPIAEICRRARERGIAVCIDGPHAIAQLPLEIEALGCDFYTASCHKWLSAPFGTGFLYVAPCWQQRVRPTRLSWGLLLPDKPSKWSDEFFWCGTRDPSAYLSIPAAIDFMEMRVGCSEFRQRTYELARRTALRLMADFHSEPIAPNLSEWYGSMAHVPITPGDSRALQNALWQRYAIEVPIIDFGGRRFVRVSMHLYNRLEHIDRLATALRELTKQS